MPDVWRNRSRTVIGRLLRQSSPYSVLPVAGSVFWNATRMSSSSGRYRATGASRSSLPSSTRIMAATLVTGLDIEAIQKMEFVFIGIVLARS